MSASLAVRVDDGARWLDQQWPGWAYRVDLDLLDMQWPTQCVLGQLYYHYRFGVADLPVNPATFGFTWLTADMYATGVTGWADAVRAGFADLTREWAVVIRGRRHG